MSATTAPRLPRVLLRTDRGDILPVDVVRWFASPPAEEQTLLNRVQGPALDIGCGPGRHVLALMRRGVSASGIELTPAVARLARQQGAAVMEGSVFDAVPGIGKWRTALLLDGNIGIGGDPLSLLRRVRHLLATGGSALVELNPPGSDTSRRRLRLEVEDTSGPWFHWTNVAADRVDALADQAGLSVHDLWEAAGRWFADLKDAAR